MIKIDDLYKSFDEKMVLKGITMEVKENETLVILGPSGQGKTVLIKSMVRLLWPDSGRVEYDGNNIFTMKRQAFVNVQKQIAFVFQHSALFDFLDVKDNLGLYLRMHTRLSSSQIMDEVHRAIHFVGLEEDVLDKFPEELSGGMKKRVAIARALIKKPRFIFYDEPTTGLDKGNAEKVSQLIIMLKNEIAATSIIVTHDIKLMREVSDRVVLLKEGRIAFTGKKEEISPQVLEELYAQGEVNDI